MGKIRELEALLTDKTEKSRQSDDSIKEVESQIKGLISKMQISETTKKRTEENIAATIANKNKFWKKFEEVENKRLGLFYGKIKATSKGSFEIIVNETEEENLSKGTLESKSLLEEIKVGEKLINDFQDLVIMQANLLVNSKTELEKLNANLADYEANYTANVDAAEKIENEIQNKQKAIDDL